VDVRFGNNEYGTIMFAEFEQRVQKTEDCSGDCSNQKYFLKAAHLDYRSWTSFEIKGDGIVTSMRLFYKHIFLTYAGKTNDQGSVFTGL